MNILYHPIVLEHETGNHPENKNRIVSLGELPVTELPLSEEPLLRIHSRQYIDQVKTACAASAPLDNDTQTSPKSFDAALYAAAATIRASQTDGFAVVRPPGHHAHAHQAEGFCLFNNMAIASQLLVDAGKRVLIVDIDGHLGDGTEEIFYESDQALYFSLHQYPAFPQKGYVSEIGRNKGLGYTINVPLPPSSGDDVYLRAMKKIIPIVIQFKPDVVGVSAGFDGHHADPLLDLNLTMDVYYEIGKMLKDTFPHIFATLEGGYNTDFFPKCFYNFVDGIEGKPKRFSEETKESTILTMETFENDLDALLRNLKPYWQI